MDYTIKKILVPVDFSDYSKLSIKYASALASAFNAEIILVYVVEPVIYPPDFSMGQIAIPTVDQEMNQKASEELTKLAATEISRGTIVKVLVKTGKPFLEIVDTAAEEDADLIIISSHGHTGVEHILFGSTAEKVVRKAPCPVLTLREPIKGFQYKEAFPGKKGN